MTKEERRLLIKKIALRAKEMGGRAMLVGGCVRDGLLGRESADIDCEVYGLAPEALRQLAEEFGSVDESGARFGIFSLKEAGIDLAVPRTETRRGRLHGDFDVELNGGLSAKKAASRRDFTVNAISQDALTGEIVDPFGGRADLEKGILRAVPGGQFEEDPLRVLRGAQFAARFALSPDEETLAAMRRMDVRTLSPARVTDETKKALLRAAHPEKYFEVLAAAGALSFWFKEVADLIGVPQNPQYHPEGDAFKHTMLVVREAAALRARTKDPFAFMMAALTHDLGKATTTKKNEKGNWASIGHELAGVPLIEALAGRLGLSKAVTAYCVNMCRLHMRVHTCFFGNARTARTNVLFDASCCAEELALLALCDARGTGKPREQADREGAFIAERLSAYRSAGPMPTGAMVLEAGGRPGPAMKQALQKAREQVLSGKPLEEAVRLAAQKTKRAAENGRD